MIHDWPLTGLIEGEYRDLQRDEPSWGRSQLGTWQHGPLAQCIAVESDGTVFFESAQFS